MQVLQSDGQLLGIDLEFDWQQGRQFDEILGHIAIVIQIVDQESNNALVPVGHLHQIDLVEQVIAQLGRFGRRLRCFRVVIAILPAEGPIPVVERPVGFAGGVFVCRPALGGCRGGFGFG